MINHSLIEEYKTRLRKPRFVLTALLLTILGLILTALIPQIAGIKATSGLFGLWAGVKIAFKLLGTLFTNQTWYSLLLLVLNLWFSISMFMLLIEYYKAQSIPSSAKRSHAGTGIAGVGGVLAFLGIGCAACGAALLTAILSWVGGVSLLTILPLHGVEFSIIALGFLLYGHYYILGKIQTGITCSVVIEPSKTE